MALLLKLLIVNRLKLNIEALLSPPAIAVCMADAGRIYVKDAIPSGGPMGRGNLVLRRSRKVAFAYLHLHAFPAALHPKMPESAVKLGVKGCISGHILGAQFVFNLLERSFKFLAVVAHVDEASTRFFGEPLHG